MKKITSIITIMVTAVTFSACGGSNAPKTVDGFQHNWYEGTDYEREDACTAYGYFEGNLEAFIAFMVSDLVDDKLAEGIYDFMSEVC